MKPISMRRRIRTRRAVGWSRAGFHNPRWRSTVALQALDQLGAGVIVTDNCGQIVEMNRVAESIVRLEDGLMIRNGQLCAGRVFESAKVAKLIAGAAVEDKAAMAARRMLVRRQDGRPAYVLTVAPLRAELAVDDRPFAMIVVVDPARHSPSERDLAEFFELSPAEARLAVALLTRKKLAEIAGNTGIQITTLRTQLSAVLRKVGVKRQFDLVRMLSGTGIGSVSLSAGWLDVGLSFAQSAA